MERESATPLSSVLKSALERQPPLDPEAGHSVVLLITASDLLPPPNNGRDGAGEGSSSSKPSDEAQFRAILRSLRGRNVSVIIVRLHGAPPLLPQPPDLCVVLRLVPLHACLTFPPSLVLPVSWQARTSVGSSA